MTASASRRPRRGRARSASGNGPYDGPCIERPDPGPAVEWLADDLPLPDETYPVTQLSHDTFRRAVLAVPMPYAEFVDFANDQWPSHGWVRGQGEDEPGEAESNFIRGREYGAFRARRVYCEEGWSEIVLSIGTGPVIRSPRTPSAPSTTETVTDEVKARAYAPRRSNVL